MRKRLHQGVDTRPTLADVAARASVSTATVSRFFSTPEILSPSSAERVRRAIDDLGYRPHGAARALASKRTGVIGAIVPTLDGAIFASFLQELQHHVVDANKTLMVSSSNYDPKQEREQIDNMVVRGIDGVILTGEDRDHEIYEILTSYGVRFINAYVYHRGSPHPCVGFDNAAAMRRMVRYLHDLGHREFAMIAGITEGNDRARERVAGTKLGLEELNLPLSAGRLVECHYSISAGRQAMRRLYEQDSNITAVLCGNDVLALGALFEIQSMGLSVPNDISVTGFDDLEIAKEIIPGITTIHAPVNEMGRVASEFLLGSDDASVAFQVELPAEIIFRGTTAQPPQG